MAVALSVVTASTVIVTDRAFAQSGQLEEIVVTGSRILRRDFTAASPIVTVGAETFENISTVGVESALNQLPQFQPAQTQFTNADVQATAFNTPGISTVNLRGIGTNRNLVLIDGRRAQPVNATLVVDVNSIPAAAIERVEVITGGASAVYGADAVGGVVNFILKDDFEGLSIDLQTSTTAEGDGEETRLSVLTGANLADGRGNVMFGIEWADRKSVFDADRAFYVEGWDDPGTGTGGFLSQTGYVPLANPPSFVGAAQINPAATPFLEFYVNPDGTLFQQALASEYTGPVGPGTRWKINSYNGQVNDVFRDGFVSSPLTRYSGFAKSRYEVTDNVSVFTQANFASWKVDGLFVYAPAVEFWAAEIPRDADHPVPPELDALLDSRQNPNAPWTLRRVLDWNGPRFTYNTNNIYQVLFGGEGTFDNNDWTWEAFVSQGRTTVLTELDRFTSVARWRELVTAPNYGRDYSRVNNELQYRIECTSGLPIFDYSIEVSQDCIDSMFVRMKNTTDFEQKVAEFNLQGGIVEMRGSELRFAVGASARENSVLFQPDLLNDNESIIDFPAGLFSANTAGGSTDVSELYGELLVPLAERFNLELGIRSSDYDTVGSTTTYKALFDWSATERLRFRGGRQVANRAPNTAELFLGSTEVVVFVPGGDPCVADTPATPRFLLNSWGNVSDNLNRAQVQALCSALINEPGSIFDANPSGFTGPGFYFPLELELRVGNPLVDKERAETYTLGVVYGADRFTIAADLYDIEVLDAIGPLPALAIYQQCFNADGVSNPTYSINDPGGYCSLITRQPGSGLRLAVDSPYRNLGLIKTTGLDIQFNWNGDIRENSIFVNSQLNYVDSFETQDTPLSPIVENAGTLAQGGQYEWRFLTTVGYSLADVSLGLRWRHLPATESAAFATNPLTATLGVDAYDTFDFFGAWEATERVRVRFGIDNLLDEDPEIVDETPGQNNNKGNTLANFYDVLGRRVYVGVNWAF